MELPTRRSMRMMTSVSILLRMIGAAIAVSVSNGFGMSASHGPDVGNGAENRGRRRARRTRQMGARAGPLPADKIAVRGGDRALSGRHHFAVGSEAHRAARLAPLKSCLGKNLV